MGELVVGDGQAFVPLKALDADRRGLRILSAVDSQTGKQGGQTTFKTGTVTASVFLGGRVDIGVAGGDSAIAANSGQERWRYRWTMDFPGRLPAIDGGVYGGDNWLDAVNRETGAELWRPTQPRRTVEGKNRRSCPRAWCKHRVCQVGDPSSPWP